MQSTTSWTESHRQAEQNNVHFGFRWYMYKFQNKEASKEMIEGGKTITKNIMIWKILKYFDGRSTLIQIVGCRKWLKITWQNLSLLYKWCLEEIKQIVSFNKSVMPVKKIYFERINKKPEILNNNQKIIEIHEVLWQHILTFNILQNHMRGNAGEIKWSGTSE